MKNDSDTSIEVFSKIGTLCIHAGQEPDPCTGAVMVPISLSTTFRQSSPGVNLGFEYSRTNNPTRQQYEKCVAALEKGKYAVAFASGSATTSTILAMFSPGDHVVTIDDVYGGTNRFFRKISSVASGIRYSFVNFSDESALEAAFTSNTKLVWMETPTNPTLKVVDIERIAKHAHSHHCLLLVDNTFLSPYFQNPLLFGADLVMHSITKYINGHSDVVGGIVVTNDDEIYKKLRFLQNGMGAVPSPFDCFMAMRGIKTLHVRMQQHERNAISVAKFLEASDKVAKVSYPGLPSHPNHEIAKRQQRGFGGMVTFWLKGGIQQARQFLENLRLFALAESLGGVESLAEHPAIMTHASVSAEERAKLGINDSLCRLSVGIEDIDDIIKDLTNALNAVHLQN
jgi:cystathionine gamma-lyase